MKKKKILVFLPDGGGLRNFAFSSFQEIGDSMGFDVQYLNNSGFPLKEKLNYNEVSNQKIATHSLTLLFARARRDIELNIFKKKFKDAVYDDYKFPLPFKGIKNSLKSAFILFLINFYSSEKGLKKIKDKIEKLERSTNNYQQLKAQLQVLQPELIFCSNQRNTLAISTVLAARDLGLKSVCFIQSWDNVPKAMQVLETDYYFVWSDLMQDELLKYYPFISKDQIFVTGTPQFEPHFDSSLKQTREEFLKQYGLDCNKKYVCFSGDDETTSPLDQYYLEDLAQAIRSLNSKGQNLGIIFRRCPVDFSNRYDSVIASYKDVIMVVDPIWEKRDEKQGFALPTKQDFAMLYNVCEHSEFVTNVCSSTVFDFVTHHKSCIYYNYEQPQLKKGIRDIGQNYRYVHFRSMPSHEAVIFCTHKNQLEQLVLEVVKNEISNVREGLRWFEIVAGKTPTKSSLNIWNALNKIIES